MKLQSPIPIVSKFSLIGSVSLKVNQSSYNCAPSYTSIYASSIPFSKYSFDSTERGTLTRLEEISNCIGLTIPNSYCIDTPNVKVIAITPPVDDFTDIYTTLMPVVRLLVICLFISTFGTSKSNLIASLASSLWVLLLKRTEG